MSKVRQPAPRWWGYASLAIGALHLLFGVLELRYARETGGTVAQGVVELALGVAFAITGVVIVVRRR